MTRAYVSGIAYTTGRRRDVASLLGPDDAELADRLRGQAMPSFYDDERTIPEMWRATASETFRRAAKSPRTVDSVVGVTSPVDANQLLGSLHDIGVGRALILGLAFQQCSGTAAALRLAADLIAGGRRDVLVVQCGRCLPDERIDRRRRLVFSDAAASCVVSSEDGELEILSSESATDPGLAAAHDLAEYGQRDVMRAARLLRGVLDDAMKSAGVTMPEVRAVFCATGNTDSLIFMSEAAGLPKDAVHRSGLARHGHVLGCDGLIGLVDYADEQPLSVGDCLLLYSWSSCVVGATVLRYRGSARTV